MLLTAVISLAAMGLVLGTGLVLASKYLAVEVDPRVEKVAEELPGANCGACSYPGCSGFAFAVVSGAADVTACAPGGKATAERIAALLGRDVGEMADEVALVRCGGGNRVAKRKSDYVGIADCAAAELVGGGDKLCPYGCLGLGSCQLACPFGAVVITADRLAVVDRAKCTGCKKCVAACPRGIIGMVPRSAKVHVLCSSKDKAKVVKSYCEVGCVACKLCGRESKAFDVASGLSVVQYDHDGEVPEAAVLVCAPGAVVDTRRYDLLEWVSSEAPRKDFEERAAAHKEEQKRLKAEKKAKKEKKERAEESGEGDGAQPERPVRAKAGAEESKAEGVGSTDEAGSSGSASDGGEA